MKLLKQYFSFNGLLILIHVVIITLMGTFARYSNAHKEDSLTYSSN